MARSMRPVTVIAVLALAGVSCSHSHEAYRAAATANLTVRYPSSWARNPHPPPSPGLQLLSEGPGAQPGCPKPLLLVRQDDKATGTLDQAVLLYNRLEQLRRPARKVIDQHAVSLAGTKAAVLIVAQYPMVTSGAPVRTFDLLAQTPTGGAVHLFASGCPADIPDQFLQQAVMSLQVR